MKDFKCKHKNCFASDLAHQCLLKKSSLFGLKCLDYFPKISDDADKNGIFFAHLYHKHNLLTRYISVLAVFISIVAIVISILSIKSSDRDRVLLNKHLENFSRTFEQMLRDSSPILQGHRAPGSNLKTGRLQKTRRVQTQK